MSFKKTIRSSYLGNLFSGFKQWYIRISFNYRKEMGYCDETASIVNPIVFKNPKNMYVYDHTIVRRAIIMTPEAKFIMKRYSGAAEGLVVLTGNHDRFIGRFYRTIKQSEKKTKDQDVIVEEDCQLGVNVTLLPGVIVRRGTTVAAGAVVTKPTAPYSVYGGIPAKHLKFYWNIDQILEHESMLYPEEERYTREQLEMFFKMYQK